MIQARWSRCFAQPAETTFLWRYMSLESFSLMLRKGAYFRSIATHRKKNDGLEGECLAWFDDLQEAISKLPEERRAFLERHRTTLSQNPFDADVAFFSSDNWKHRDSIERAFIDYMAKARCAWCWYKSERESSAMWSAFAPRGIAIKTTLNQLKSTLPADRGFLIGDVGYYDGNLQSNHSIAMESESDRERVLLHPYFTKRPEFEGETEVRVVTSCPYGSEAEIIKLLDPVALVGSIVVAPTRSIEEHEMLCGEVLGILAESFPKVTAQKDHRDRLTLSVSLEVDKEPRSICIEPSSICAPTLEREMERAALLGDVASVLRTFQPVTPEWPVIFE